jgi:SM-20-related protein
MNEGQAVSSPPAVGQASGNSEIFERIATALERDGYVILPEALPVGIADGLFLDLQSLGDEDFQRGGVGRQDNYQLNRLVRTDRICWLEGKSPVVRDFLDWIEVLRRELNRRLFLGLFDYECHYATYPVGAYYKMHVDAFKGQSNRVLSTVFYLNPVWNSDDGGELFIYAEDGTRILEKIAPEYGKLVIFLSELFPHEVVAARRERYSIAGWFRVNNSSAMAVDPPR